MTGTILAGALGLTGAGLAYELENDGDGQPHAADEIDRIVVTASGFQQFLEHAPASVTLIPRVELEQQRTSSLAEALSTVQGIDVSNSQGKTGGVSISVRGMPSDYSLVLVDGRRQNPAGNVTPNGFGETGSSFIPPVSAIERIEVVRGPMSTLYGSDAMGGVINIITREPRDGLQGEITVDTTLQGDDEYGNTYSASGYVDGAIRPGLLSFALRGRYYHREAADLTYTDVNGNPLGVSQRGPSPVEAEIWSLGGRLNLTPHPDHRLWLDYDLTRQEYDNSTGQLGTLGVQGYGPTQEFNRDQIVLAHTWNLLGGTLDSDITRNVTETIGRVLPDDVPGTSRRQGDPRDLEATNTIFNTRYSRAFGAHTLTIGGQYWDAEMVDGVAPEPFTHEQWAVFGENEWRIMDTLRLTVGARHDNHNVFGDHFSPRAYLVWNATDMVTLRGGVSRGFKTPRLDQIAEGIVGFTAQGTRPTLGTPTLQPETSTTYEAGIYFDNRSNLQVNATVFYNLFDNKIASGTPLANCSFGLTEAEYAALPANPSGCTDVGYWPVVAEFSQNVNIDEAETRGIELYARWDVTDTVRASGNYTWTDSEQKSGANAGEPLVNTPDHMLNGRIDWRFSDALNFWLRGEYRSERYRGSGIVQDQLGSFSAYTVAHAGGAWHVNEQVTLNATVYNLFDQDFVSYLPYVAANGSTAYASEYANLQEPRRLWVSMNVRF
ncbi:TonB-dependent receptor [Glycocaulis alkaliphilus]|uniref:TonB-dependent receptor n=1 Tax=Glycocaulis alkaliphilus TaxID=1434191 RepID=A0A3T0E9H4_9PROT|nr:TonB-dependent receptor [Glycocaulis alkaliphilus]